MNLTKALVCAVVLSISTAANATIAVINSGDSRIIPAIDGSRNDCPRFIIGNASGWRVDIQAKDADDALAQAKREFGEEGRLLDQYVACVTTVPWKGE